MRWRDWIHATFPLWGAVTIVATIWAGASCTSARQRGAASAGAFLDCQAPNLAAAVVDLLPMAKDALMLAISGDGHVDTTRIKASAAGLKSDLGKCTLAAAVAALATPTPSQPGAPAAAELAVDGVALRAAFTSARVQLGWAPVLLANGVTL